MPESLKRSLRILLADDHPLFRKGLRVLIESLNVSCHILEAGNGQEALHLSEHHPIDLFILDIKMPVMDGYDLTRILLRRNSKHKIIILTMYSEPALIKSLFRLGVSGFVIKNSEAEEIQDAIQSVVGGDLYYNDEFREVIHKELRSNSYVSFRFTSREMELIQLLSKGKTSRDIAQNLGLTLKTIETYRCRVLEKAGVRNTTELLSHCHSNGLL